jgi:putative ABC transport system permease protein
MDEASFRPVSVGYFRTSGIPLVEGRDFTRFDSSQGPLTAIVNQAFVRRHFPEASPLGERIVVFGAPREVVGVVADVHFAGLDVATLPAMYLPLEQNPQPGLTVLLRSEGDPLDVVASVREQMAAVDPGLALFDLTTAEAALDGSLGKRRFSTALLLLFAGVALALAAVGVYGVIAYAVAQRTREMGVRLALGASPADLRRLVLRHGMALVAAALVLGFGLSAAASRLLEGLLFGVDSTDPPTLVAVAALLALAALGASLLPARRAMRVDPLEALRSE